MTKFIFRLILIPFSAFALVQLVVTFFGYIGIYMGLSTLISWILAMLIIELFICTKGYDCVSRQLKSLLYAPIMIGIFSIIFVNAYDLGMIEYTKLEIRNYIFSGSKDVNKIELDLFTNIRCSGGFSCCTILNTTSELENKLYFKTASMGFNSQNPHIRARSLLMASQVRNPFNEVDKRFEKQLKQSCLDANEIVKKTAETFLNEQNSSCQKIID